MKTRSQVKKEVVCIVSNATVAKTINAVDNDRDYPVIDFDEASRCWHANKKRLTNGCYQYVCGTELVDWTFCKRKICKNSATCSIHKKINK